MINITYRLFWKRVNIKKRKRRRGTAKKNTNSW